MSADPEAWDRGSKTATPRCFSDSRVGNTQIHHQSVQTTPAKMGTWMVSIIRQHHKPTFSPNQRQRSPQVLCHSLLVHLRFCCCCCCYWLEANKLAKCLERVHLCKFQGQPLPYSPPLPIPCLHTDRRTD